MNFIAVQGAVSERDANLIRSVVSGIVPELRAHFEEMQAPLQQRITELESRQPEKGDPGESGPQGVSITDALTDSEGAIVLTLSDGSTRKLAVTSEALSDEIFEPLVRRIEELEAVQPEKGERGEMGPKGEPGLSGLSVKNLLIDRDGHLRCVMADGSDFDLGPVVGKDGADGKDGKDADMEAIEHHITELVAALPDPKDGKDGVDGKTPEVDFTRDGDSAVLSFDWGEDRQEFEIAMPYAGKACGLYDPEAQYRALDVVTFNGSEWRAKRDNPGALPGDGWMLSAQRGKRGETGQRGERGMDGRAGKDGAQPIEIRFDPEKMQLLMVLDDGHLLEADFAPIVRAIREEE